MKTSAFIKLSGTSSLDLPKPLSSGLCFCLYFFMACHRTPAKEANNRSDQCQVTPA